MIQHPKNATNTAPAKTRQQRDLWLARMAAECEAEEHGAPAPPCWEQALGVCLGRGSADFHTVCMLLVTAKQLRALVHECCRPASLVDCFRLRTLVRGRGFAAWLSQHGSLLGDLELDLAISPVEQGAPGEPQQQHPADAILAQVPGSLTRLVVHHFGSVSGADISDRAASLATALAVQPLQQLRELQLLDGYAASDQVVRSVLAGSSQLTSVVVSTAIGMTAEEVMQCLTAPLPAQLQQLVVDSRGTLDTCAPLALAHLTRLTRLVMPAPLGSGSVPGSVVSLGVAASADAAPQLLALTQLTRLQLMVAARLPAAQLRSLSGLRQLQHLELFTSDRTSQAPFVAHAASSFGVLPLKRLEAWGNAAEQLTAASLADMGRCTGLTRLALSFYTFAPGASVEQLAAALARLTALQRLTMSSLDMLTHTMATPGAEALARAVGGLQRLTDCDLSGLVLGPAVEHLGGATALTSLLPGHSLDDGMLAALCRRARQLQDLNVGGSPRLTDTSLAMIAATQHQLTRLSLPTRGARGITAAGLAQLTAALPRLTIDGLDSILTEDDSSDWDELLPLDEHE